jgi:hypothetical protein
MARYGISQVFIKSELASVNKTAPSSRDVTISRPVNPPPDSPWIDPAWLAFDAAFGWVG